MGKIIPLLLFIAAVVVAVVYLLKGRRIEKQDVAKASGWKRPVLMTAAILLAIVGASRPGSGETAEPADPPGREIESPDKLAAAWAQLRTAWHEIDKYSSEGWKELEEEREVKRKEHVEVVKVLADSGALSQSVAGVLEKTFHTTTDSAFFRGAAKGVGVKCYMMSMIGHTSVRAQGQLAKSAMHLAELEAAGKLSEEVIKKTRTQIARDMQIIMYAKTSPSHEDASVFLEAYAKGEEIEIPVEVKQAADVLMQLLTSDEPPTVTSTHGTKPSLAAQSKTCSALRKMWLEIDEYPGLKDYRGFEKLRKVKVAGYEKALSDLVAAGAIGEKTSTVLKGAFASASNSTVHRRGMITCYDMSMNGAAGARAESEILKASASLAELADSGKLSEQVVGKVRKQLARALQMIAVVKKWDDPTVRKMAEAYMAGKEIDKPVPEEFVKAAGVLTHIMATSK